MLVLGRKEAQTPGSKGVTRVLLGTICSRRPAAPRAAAASRGREWPRARARRRRAGPPTSRREDSTAHAWHALPGTRVLTQEPSGAATARAPPLGRLARVRDRVLEHVPVLAADSDGGAFERALLRVPIQLLEQAAAAPKGDVVEGPSVGFERGADRAQRLVVDAVAPNQADVGVQDLVALFVHLTCANEAVAPTGAEVASRRPPSSARRRRDAIRVLLWPHRQAIAATVASTACRSTDDYAKRRHLEATDAGERTAELLVEQLEAF